MIDKYKYQDLTGEIIAACYEVHNTLGCGFFEKVYQEALAVEMCEREIEYEREKHLSIYYHGEELECDYVADFVVDGKVIVELKAVTEMDSVFEAQVLNYLKATGLQVGLLVNFGRESLQIKRFAANMY